MDIRRYFGGSPGKSALTELRASKGSPERTNPQSQKTQQKKPSKSKKTVPTEVLLSETSDEENPMPRSVRRELGKKRSKKRIVLSSDDDEELPPSASQARLPKKAEKISTKKSDSKPIKNPVKRTAKRSSDEEIEEVEDLDEFVPAPPPTKRRRGRTPPGQTKLELSTVADKKKTEPPKKKAAKLAPELEVVDPAEFFQNFGKTAKETKSGEPSGSKETKTKSPKKADKVVVSPRTSPRKTKPESSEGISLADVIMLSEEKEKISRPPSRSQTKGVASSKKSPKETKSAEKIPSPKVKEVEKKKEVEKRKKIEKEKENVGKVKEKHVTEEKRAKTTHVTEQKSPKAKKTAEVKSPKATTKLSEAERTSRQELSLPWVDKYKPSNLTHLVGQSGEKSPMNKLLGWLRDWAKNHLGEGGRQKKARPPPWLAQTDGTAFKAVMLSGPPGVGKTTCAQMACKELGLRFVEKNASDVRNKKILEAETSELIGCRQMDGFMESSSARKEHKSDEITHVLIMDEVDGMSGNEDRAGIAELIQMIKETRIPIICICNDRQSQKIRSLMNYCFDLRFQRPRVEQIRARLLTIACQEKVKVDKEQMDEVIEAAQHDVRQSIYNLQLLGSGGKGIEVQRKDAALNPFEASRRLLNADTPVWEKQRMFFVDYSIMPLFVQENYPFVQNSKMSMSERLCALKKAANSISQGDIIERTIRTTGAWSLLNEQALFSSVAPTTYMNGYMKGMINFPSWLGKNSTMTKRQRLLRQLSTHTYLTAFAATHPMVLDYVPALRQRYCHLLLDKESEGVNDVVEMYKEYSLIRDDTESIAELAVWPGMKDPGAAIPVRVKAALTRTLNKEHIMLPYALDTVMKGRKKAPAGTDLDLELDEEGNVIEEADVENALEGSEGESDDDDFAGVTKKKAGTVGESGGARGGRGRGGGRGAARGSRGGGGRGRGIKK